MHESAPKNEEKLDRNSLVALVRSFEESVAALNRRKEAITVESQIGPVDAQISVLESKLRDTRAELEGLIDNN